MRRVDGMRMVRKIVGPGLSACILASRLDELRKSFEEIDKD